MKSVFLQAAFSFIQGSAVKSLLLSRAALTDDVKILIYIGHVLSSPSYNSCDVLTSSVRAALLKSRDLTNLLASERQSDTLIPFACKPLVL